MGQDTPVARDGTRLEGVRSALMVHGAGGGGWEWNVWRAVFEASGIVVASPDLQPAAGGLAVTCFHDYLDQIEQALQALPRPRAVIGASLGGLLVLRVAGNADALLLVNPLPPAPWHASLRPRDWPDVVPWRRQARLASTRDALRGSDDATALCAFRQWRNESGSVLREASRGVAAQPPRCPTLLLVSRLDEDIPLSAAHAMAEAWGSDVRLTASHCHVGPLLGREAASVAGLAVEWLNGSLSAS